MILSYLKCPINFEKVKYTDRRLYINYLECKGQTEEGIFRVCRGNVGRTQYRIIKKLIERGWATRCKKTEDGHISLKAYQFVWRDLGIKRVKGKYGDRFCYYKIPIESLADKRVEYLKEIDNIIKKKLAKRKAAQIRWNLNRNGVKDNTQANFSAKSAASLFGYKSSSSGSKLRKENFCIIPEPTRYFFNTRTGRYEEFTKRIAL